MARRGGGAQGGACVRGEHNHNTEVCTGANTSALRDYLGSQGCTVRVLESVRLCVRQSPHSTCAQRCALGPSSGLERCPAAGTGVPQTRRTRARASWCQTPRPSQELQGGGRWVAPGKTSHLGQQLQNSVSSRSTMNTHARAHHTSSLSPGWSIRNSTVSRGGAVGGIHCNLVRGPQGEVVQVEAQGVLASRFTQQTQAVTQPWTHTWKVPTIEGWATSLPQR
jgi:hypothetical protein